ncbi:hypothetical protein I3843_05G049600 [Carya illinoinensis]|uniref:Uncharacterized protein n=1 Tax=Carya illinoinensis TaxID=32201 RepID=A0A922JKY1_CARIL|nr:hypothetical protein I3760_05G057200 [Carya illinoinensis]KAG6711488.1 hypothetical protein I3842_05G056700 [Carya illinoinensis]KAG7977794.1 hypothetical protein I3843_05G049600 [Carya illinoinensis]
MVIQRLEMCMELIRMAIEFVMVVAEAVGIVIGHQNGTGLPPRPSPTSYPVYGNLIPFLGLLP